MNWHKIYIHHDITDVQKNVRMLLEFNDLRTRLKMPIGLNLFEPLEQVRGGSVYYAPPPIEKQFADFLARYSAVPCEKPGGSGLKAVVGTTKDFEHWFSDK